MFVGLVEAEVRGPKLADSEVVFEGTADESANEPWLMLYLRTFWKMNHNFYAEREFRIRSKVYRKPGSVESEAEWISSALTVSTILCPA